MTLEAILSDAGYRVLGPASTYSRALELAASSPPSIAFVNIRLRDGPTGIEVARTLHTQFGTSNFFASAQTSDAAANADFALGFITKPYEQEAVLSAIDLANRIRSGEVITAPLPRGITIFPPYLAR
jgi:two-component system, response regulator PdtaR